MKPKDEIHFEHPELRFGYVNELYEMVTGTKTPNQLDLLNRWFPGLIVKIREGDGTKKEIPEYDDDKRIIYASRYHSHLYMTGNPRITQIAGRLTGTSSSNREKERANGELIQKKVTRIFLSDLLALPDFLDHVEEMISSLNEEQTDLFHYLVYMFCLQTAEAYYAKTEDERDEELYAFDQEVFDALIYNAFYQIMHYDHKGLCRGYAWLLLGSLLRNSCGRLTRVYDSSFVPLFRAPGENGSLLSQLHYLFAPEDFESYYAGEIQGERFPGIEWYCDECQDHLNDQPGFDDHLEFWQCRKCGHINAIEADDIYETEEDYRNGIQRKPFEYPTND